MQERWLRRKKVQVSNTINISNQPVKRKLTTSFPVNEKGWYLFPKQDADLRKKLFPEEVMKHKARANLYLMQAIIDLVSKPGDRILDPMSGSGSIMIAAISGRSVVCIEIEEAFYNIILLGAAKLNAAYPGLIDRLMLLNGNCESFLPLPVDHVIFSPPYASIMKKSGKLSAGDITRDFYGEDDLQMYSKTPGNVGRLSKFLYNMEMEKIYKLLYQSVKVGGTISIIIKDYVEQGKRVYLSDWVTKVCIRAGFSMTDWFKWEPKGTPYQALWKKKGVAVIADEDILIFEKTR